MRAGGQGGQLPAPSGALTAFSGGASVVQLPPLSPGHGAGGRPRDGSQRKCRGDQQAQSQPWGVQSWGDWTEPLSQEPQLLTTWGSLASDALIMPSVKQSFNRHRVRSLSQELWAPFSPRLLARA